MTTPDKTGEDIAQVLNAPDYPWPDDWPALLAQSIAAAIKEAVAGERAKCADLAAVFGMCGCQQLPCQHWGSANITAAIRARKD